MSNLLHKVKDAVTGEKDGHGVTPHNAGPHSSNISNKTDPLDNPTSTMGSSHRDHGAGIHSPTQGSNLQDKLDPRVHSSTTSNLTPADAGYGTSTAHDNNAGYGTTSTGLGHGVGHGTTSSATPGSNLKDKLDPRVHSSTTSNLTPADAGYGTSTAHDNNAGYGTTSTGLGHGVGHGTTSSATPGSGATHHTAGPHDSDFANKLDPRVDSNMDGSKTFGGTQTGI